ncbi:(2Fe-2S)-binding protein [Amphritea balenae]|uniref:(2Fe-2S)-binding protein n=1 Tax=Amphritea balenae TaxID=452629 RepID=UPI001E41F42B|nr:(2Fe-2S)-binding protein [Amphritea balenae]
MFRSVTKQQDPMTAVQVTINDTLVSVVPGTTVWAAMALAGETATRVSPVNQQVRSAYCAMGVCFECMVEINGMPNRQACLTEVVDGMQINRQVITEATIAELQTELKVEPQPQDVTGNLSELTATGSSLAADVTENIKTGE